MAGKQTGSRKVGRHARVAEKDTILRDEGGKVMEHMGLMRRLGLDGGFVFAHGKQQQRTKKAH